MRIIICTVAQFFFQWRVSGRNLSSAAITKTVHTELTYSTPGSNWVKSRYQTMVFFTNKIEKL